MQLTLYIPGLLGPAAAFSGELAPRAPALEFLLGRATRSAHAPRSYHRTLADLFGLPGGDEPPAAALLRLAAGEEIGAASWMRADPVHLAADRSGLVLLDSSAFPLSEEDARTIAEDLRPLLAAAGAVLHVASPHRWYLEVQQVVPPVHGVEPGDAAGRNVLDFLPRGGESARWHRLLNEVQMQLHDHPVNRGRQERGEPAVNSLWFWGGGPLPESLPRTWSLAAGDDFVRALAQLAATRWQPVPGGPRELVGAADGDGPVLVVLEDCRRAAARGDLQDWSQCVLALEQNWFVPCRRMLRAAGFKNLCILTDRCRFRLSRLAPWCLWRRPLPVARVAAGAR